MTEEKKTVKKKVVKPFQTQLNEIDKQIEELQIKKKSIAKLAVKEIKEEVEMPLHQLNLISTIGYEKAKAKFGDNWVE